MSQRIETSIEINADPSKVWEVLSDFGSYPDWNPFIVSLQGKPEVGERLNVELRTVAGKRMKFTPTVLVWEPGRALIWRGKVLFRGIFDGEHRFELESAGEGRTRLSHTETFTGFLLPLIWNSMKDDTRRGFESMNEALKVRVEGRVKNLQSPTA
jgi:hypothetical protein